ncbi:elongation factor-like GTPase 1 [Rhagoletis pomonella]|uniref:elongation factor-like GTPase 1 n=1 Tax=Rhagoletis pomonella TaxID=28610 RepID=UPI00177D64BA|nr:elongation factor-like GTPase 1 [Rhagoletis pomonella]
MPIIDTNTLVKLQKDIERVRNICILAHVDHGKTTLADSLVASNGIISQRMAGKLRYLDTRQDEQERGITMKSSSISLYYRGGADHADNEQDYLVNLIDSPGHVDFSSEVSTAVRLCDGAIVVVDVVEGVCPQTRACLEQVYTEQLKPVLVLNKIDRLIMEMQLKPLDAYFHISQILEQVNAVLGSIFASDVLSKEDITKKDNYESALEEVDDSNLYFSPAAGNVIFCSAYDGWAFSVSDFAKIYSKRLEMTQSDLEQVLWGDFFYNTKQKYALAGAQEKAKKPMFVQFVLENIWSLYDIIAVRKDKEKLPIIAEKLGIKLQARDLRISDPKVQIKTVFGQWLPIDRTVLEMVVRHVPPPNVISDERAERLLFPRNVALNAYSKETLLLKEDFKRCSDESPNVIVFVSKMTPVHVSQLPQNKPKRLNEEQLQARREEVRRRIEERKQFAEKAELENLTVGIEQLNVEETPAQTEEQKNVEQEPPEKADYVFIAFARIFSGTLKTGMRLYNLAPKHDPRNKEQLNSDSPYISEVTIGDLYLFMGGELQALDEVPAGNIVGIGGLDEDIIKTATLSSTINCTSFSELSVMATPILRVAIEPVNPQDLPKLVKGLKLLNQADACVEVSMAPTGEHVITTLGEVHVEKCVRDLEESYAKIKVNVSEPIVSFRETIVPEATIDMVNEAIIKTATDKDITKKIITQQTANKCGTIRVIALPLPQTAVDILDKYISFFKELATNVKGITVSEKYSTLIAQIKTQLTNALTEFDLKGLTALKPTELVERIWALGPRNCGTNILLNLTDYEQPNFWQSLTHQIDVDAIAKAVSDVRRDYNSSFVNGFQLVTAAGPLCEEPMQGVAFVVLEWTVEANEDLNSKSYGPFSGQVLTASKESCRMAFQAQPQRLVSPMYSCNIVVNAEVLGKMYAVIGRRHGKILSGDLTQGSGNFSVMAILPVIESFNFAQEIRKQTSGLACPQLMFSHWEIIDIDPFWVPTTEEEITHFGEKADSANRAKVYMDSVRRRKGLYVDDKVVEHAEKQRTLSKKK